MNYRLLSRSLGMICLLFAVTMLFSLPWAHPALGWRAHLPATPHAFEWNGFRGLLFSSLLSLIIGGVLFWFGRGSSGQKLFRKEAMATVGLAWVLATVLGALPYVFSGARQADGALISWVDALFESQSGFSTTGATIFKNLEDPNLLPHCILFWRCSTHFLGGLGIVVLLVAILGQGAGGKAMMRAEITGPNKDSAHSRMQKTAGVFASIYIILNAVLALIYWFSGMSAFDALCHAFGTMATGGFSTYNASLGHFNSAWIDYITVVFMILAGTNFALLLFVSMGRPDRLFADVEWRVYIGIIAFVTMAVIGFGMWSDDFANLPSAIRFALFQVVSVLTTTGYGTADFDQWNNFGRGVLIVLMFVGGCAGSTGGGMKVIRHVLLAKILRLELELSYRPRVVRPLKIGDQILDDIDLRKHILVYFGLVGATFACCWLTLITIEPDAQWTRLSQESGEEGNLLDHKLLDCASAIAATLHNIGPGLGVVGPTANYADFAPWSKLLFVFLMMLGRLEMYSILVLFVPAFWRRI
ncbi:MAG: TrkH family potassium uptake protein [Planctomycetales bacterium]|nr:TrkH family potassium uptake protein [Planctomycetales bacterium]